MAMTTDGLATKIKTALSSVNDQPDAISKLSNAIKEYIQDNCELSYAWVGIAPGPVTDTVTSFTASLTFTSFSLSVTDLPTAAGAVNSLGLSLGANLAGGVVTPPVGFALSPPYLIPTPLSPLTASQATTQNDAINHLVEEIISGVKNMANYSPILLGAHGTFLAPPGTGATLISIS